MLPPSNTRFARSQRKGQGISLSPLMEKLELVSQQQQQLLNQGMEEKKEEEEGENVVENEEAETKPAYVEEPDLPPQPLLLPPPPVAQIEVPVVPMVPRTDLLEAVKEDSEQHNMSMQQASAAHRITMQEASGQHTVSMQDLAAQIAMLTDKLETQTERHKGALEEMSGELEKTKSCLLESDRRLDERLAQVNEMQREAAEKESLQEIKRAGEVQFVEGRAKEEAEAAERKIRELTR